MPAHTLHRTLRSDRGDASIQMAIVFPVFIVLVISVVQVIMWGNARAIAQVAAREGVAAARGYKASPAQGPARAREALLRLSGGNLLTWQVSSGGSSGQRVHIRVTGRAMSLLPGLPNFPVDEAASGTVERWTTAGGERVAQGRVAGRR
ncbi:TadE/TadG family type IV pilus assembly protein [Streptomyces kronopolitis]|uniref:TadE/TadG family type IV pilus assembly protein n=1 Tax=Streptomyces kronopolitis TaxID=1612435 RepID=UPI0036891980